MQLLLKVYEPPALMNFTKKITTTATVTTTTTDFA